MNLPSVVNQCKMDEFTPEFFDASSAAWHLNKRRVGPCYVYVCCVQGCSRKVITLTDSCRYHFKKQQGQAQQINASSSQGISKPVVQRQPQHTHGSPIEPKDLSVADRVVRRRRGIQSQ